MTSDHVSYHKPNYGNCHNDNYHHKFLCGWLRESEICYEKYHCKYHDSMKQNWERGSKQR